MFKLIKPTLISVVAFLFLPHANGALSDTEGAGTEIEKVVQSLDVLSFRNSIQPRSRPDAHTLKEYGFTKILSVTDKAISLAEEDGSWYFNLRIVRDNGKSKVLCVEDSANNGGSYSSIFELTVKRSPDGFYRSSQQASGSTPLCSGGS